MQDPPLPVQLYEGALNTVGVDLGISAGGVLGWAVLAPTAGPPPGALAGEYVGATGEVGMGLGAGVNVLIGGSGRSFALQPVSVEGWVAINVTLASVTRRALNPPQCAYAHLAIKHHSPRADGSRERARAVGEQLITPSMGHEAS